MSDTAIRLNWNPQLAPDDVTIENVKEVELEGEVHLRWRCGEARLEMGQRVFLVRTGRGPRGVYLEQLIFDSVPSREHPPFEIVDVEALHSEHGEIAGRDDGEFVRQESLLVQRFIAATKSTGGSLRAIRFHPADWPGSLRCDLYDPARRMIIEAKSDCDRHTIRLAIGQLADYARLHGEPCEKVLLLPRKPHRDLIKLLESQDVAVIWEHGSTFHWHP
jgi:hypothetical protein